MKPDFRQRPGLALDNGKTYFHHGDMAEDGITPPIVPQQTYWDVHLTYNSRQHQFLRIPAPSALRALQSACFTLARSLNEAVPAKVLRIVQATKSFTVTQSNSTKDGYIEYYREDRPMNGPWVKHYLGLKDIPRTWSGQFNSAVKVRPDLSTFEGFYAQK